MIQRLQKIIAQAGIASRRHAEELIRSGQVRVNGAVVTELGSKADPEHDRVEVAGRVAEISDVPVYIVLNKPPQVVSTMADPEGRSTLRNFLRGMPERVFPVGRLDYFASGLVLLTNDGQLTARVLRAANRLRQTYWIKVKGRISESEMHEAGRAASAHFVPLKGPWAKRSAANPWYEVELTGASRDALGRALKRQDHPIEKMKRVQLATLDLGNVPEGHYRRLEPDEVDKFSRAIDRALTEKDEPTIAAQEQKHEPLPSPARIAVPPLEPPKNFPVFSAPRNPPPPLASFNRPQAHDDRSQAKPRELWRPRQGAPPPRKNAGSVGAASAPPRQPWPGAPAHRPSSPGKQDWRAQKSGGSWRGNKTGGAPRPPKQPWPGAPTHRPSSPAKSDWQQRRPGPWRGNKTAGPPRSSNNPGSSNYPRPGAPTQRPGGPPKNDWRERKPGPWRGNKFGGAPRSSSSPGSTNRPRPGAPSHRPGSPNRPSDTSGKRDWRPQKSGPWRGNKSGGPPRSQNRPPRPPNSRDSRSGPPRSRDSRSGPPRSRDSGSAAPRRPNRPNRPNRPDHDPRHTPRKSR